MSWGEVTGLSLCLLTPDMQNRRILDGLFAAAGATVHPAIETNSVLTLWSHVRTGAYSSILSQAFLFLFGEPAGIRAIPITGSSPPTASGWSCRTTNRSPHRRAPWPPWPRHWT